MRADLKLKVQNKVEILDVQGGIQSIEDSLSDNITIKPCIINGLNKESIKQLKRYATSGVADNNCNIIEVMCYEGGCIGGNTTINNQKTAKKLINNLIA